MSATLAGNLTRLDRSPTVAERARAAGIHISLWGYCRAGIPITVATLALGGCDVCSSAAEFQSS
jgi:Na+/H+ antiporter NhaD/arsenite permease-like protein